MNENEKIDVILEDMKVCCENTIPFIIDVASDFAYMLHDGIDIECDKNYKPSDIWDDVDIIRYSFSKENIAALFDSHNSMKEQLKLARIQLSRNRIFEEPSE